MFHRGEAATGPLAPSFLEDVHLRTGSAELGGVTFRFSVSPLTCL